MSRKQLRQSWGAAVLAACLLLPQVSWARGNSSWDHPGAARAPVVERWSGFSKLWDLLARLVAGDGSKNRGSIDPNGVEQTPPPPSPPAPVTSDSSGERMHLTRLRWVEGKIERGLGRLDDAEATLREARDAFVAKGIGFDAALVSLDLAMVHAERGRTAELKRLAAEMVPIFESRDVHAEAAAALLLFCQAAEAEEVTLGLLDRMALYLRRARHNPEMRFEA